MTLWLSIVGLGEDGLEGLAPAARHLVDKAAVLVGGARHLAMVPEDGRVRLTWSNPLSLLVEDIAARRGQLVCVLATGDPMAYGIGVTLAKCVPPEEMTVVPGVSAFSLAAARLGWSLAETDCLTLHGRPLALLQPAIQPGAKILILSENGKTPAQVAELLTARGCGASRMTVLEHMGGPKECRVEGIAENWQQDDCADLNTLAVACRAAPETVLLPRVPGLPDEAFRHDGQLTKREVRAATLAALAPVSGQLLWDLGAGCGSIAIEWLRAAPCAHALAVERDTARCELIADNAAALGTPQLKIIEQDILSALDEIEASDALPDAVFIGGGLASAGLFERCWQALRPGGRLVANAVTLEGEAILADRYGKTGGSLTRIAVSRAGPVGGRTGWRPLMQVTQLAAVKT